MEHINVLSLSVCAVTGVILALVLKSTGSSMGTFVSVVLCVGTAMLVFNGLISVYTRINMFTAGINQEYIKLIIKVIGISYVTEISSNICNCLENFASMHHLSCLSMTPYISLMPAIVAISSNSIAS